MTQQRWKEVFGKFCIKMKYLQLFTINVELNCHLDLTDIYLHIVKYFNIAEQIFKSIKLKKRDRYKWKKKYVKVFGSFSFLYLGLV